MSETIQFIAQDDFYFDVAPRPFPASQLVPEWWKTQFPYRIQEGNLDGKKIIVKDFESNATFKKCTPMLDALTGGYLIPLMCDVLVQNITTQDKQYNPHITWRLPAPLPVFETHSAYSVKIEKPDGYFPQAFKYNNGWHVRTPKGYSTLFTTPYGYENGVFRALTAIIDTDTSYHPITLPVWIKKDFEGIVEKGTPMVQLIPFKRTNWEATFDKYSEGEMHKLIAKHVKATIVNNYVKNYWSKKSYK